MSKQKMPPRGSPESLEFLRVWDSATHQGKLDLCNLLGVSYGRAKHVSPTYRTPVDKPKLEPFPPDVSWAEQIKIIKDMDRLMAIHLQTPSEVYIAIETDKPIGMVNFADWHIGMFGTDYDSLQKDVSTVRDEPGLYCKVGGDGYQNIIQASKIGSAHNQIPIAVQRGLFVQTLKELIEKNKVLLTGNHNYWSTLAVGEDWERELARRIKLLYIKHFGKIYWKIGEMTYPELAMHKGKFNSTFNLTHTCKQYQRLYFPEARIITIEHGHISAVEQYRYDDNECVAIRTGTYGVYDDWAQQNGYFGAHVANPTVIMYPKEDKLVVFKDISDAVTYLRAVRN